MSRGVAFGTVVCLHGGQRQFFKRSIPEGRSSIEILRYRRALAAARKRIAALAKENKDLAESSSAIFDLHLTILEDPTISERIESRIEEDLIKEAYVEHDGAKVLIAQIMRGGPDDEFYDAKVKVLQEQIEHHVEEEERRLEGMFSQARKAGLDMDELGVQLAARKAELQAVIGLPQPELTTVES